MTVINPNSVAGINSITVASGEALSVHKADGTLIRTISESTGISTFSSVSVGSATTTNNADKSINIGLGASISQHTNNTLSFGTGGDERVVIDASGDMGMGTNSPENFGGGHITLEVSGTSTTEGGVFKTATSDSAGSGASGTEMLMFTNNTTGCINVVTADPLSIYTANTERLRIDSSGRLIKGHTATYAVAGHYPSIQLSGTDYNGATLGIINNANDATGAYIQLSKQRSGSPAGATIVQDDDLVGQITFTAADGTDLTSRTAEIKGFVDGAPGSNDTPGRLSFWTTPDGAQSSLERLRIDSSGRLLVGTTDVGYPSFADNLTLADSANCGITIRSGSSNQGNIYFSRDTGTGTGTYKGMITYAHNTDALTFATGHTGRITIDSDGAVNIGSAPAQATGTHTANAILTAKGYPGDETSAAILALVRGNNTTSTAAGHTLGRIVFSDKQAGEYALIEGEAEANGAVGDTPGRLIFATCSDGATTPTEKMRISESGKVGINVTSPDDTLDVAGTAQITSNTYIGGDIYMYGNSYSGQGIHLGGSTSANKLDDYEEGTWTPQVHDGTINHLNATYVKIGRQVTVVARIYGFSDNSTNDAVRIKNLPFAADVTSVAGGSAMYSYAGDANKTVIYVDSTHSGSFNFYGGLTGAYEQLRHNELNVSAGNTDMYIIATYFAAT